MSEDPNILNTTQQNLSADTLGKNLTYYSVTTWQAFIKRVCLILVSYSDNGNNGE